MHKEKYIAALSFKWLTPFYDALVEGPISALQMRRNLVTLAGDINGRRLLDVGCGTGSLALMFKRSSPGAEITGLDGDPEILEIARRKALEAGLQVQFDQGLSFELPYPDASFDVVTTSLMLHHLDRAAKERTAAEMLRVLRPGGRLYGMDFAESRTPVSRVLRPFARHLERVADNLDGLLPVIFAEAGFRGFTEPRTYLFGGLSIFTASKP